MIKKEIYPEIFEYENFLNAEQCSYIYNICMNATQEEWDKTHEIEMSNIAEQNGYTTAEQKKYYFENIYKKNNYWAGRLLKINDKNISKHISNSIDKIYPNSIYRTNDPSYVQRQYIGGEPLGIHHDQQHTDKFIKAFVVYINDNYEGGELFFPDLDVEIKPKSGSMITFPADSNYMHGTKIVSSGSDRFVMAFFLFLKEDSDSINA